MQQTTQTTTAAYLLRTNFQKQLDKVEQLVNASMRPLMRQELLLSEEARRQALETLERWSELYRHGLEASGMIAQRGEEWLHEADQRLKLTVQELRKLDSTSEALATEKREDKARFLQEALDNVTNLIIPISDMVKVPISDKKLFVV